MPTTLITLSPQQRAELRTCASCEWIFTGHTECPKCGFATYGARFCYGPKAYRLKKTQNPWLRKQISRLTFTDTVNRCSIKGKFPTTFSWINPRPESVCNTRDFKKWFGNSKVTGNDGKPFPVYHGTDHTFTEFDFAFSRQNEGGPSFTDDQYIAQDYGSLVEAYLAIENPYVVSYKRWINNRIPCTGRLGAKGFDGIVIEEFNSGGRDGNIDGDSADIGTVYIPFISNAQILINRKE